MAWLSGHDHFSICHAGDELWEPVFAFLDPRLQHCPTDSGRDWAVIRGNGHRRQLETSLLAADD
jgi:hypothetical protein